MLNHKNNSLQFQPFHLSRKSPDIIAASDDCTLAQTRINILIPKKYNQEPVLSRLVSEYGITFNIVAALFIPKARQAGWFDLELRGKPQKIDSALSFLYELAPNVYLDIVQECITIPENNLQNCQVNPRFKPKVITRAISKNESQTLARVKVLIPKKYHQQPAIARLTSDYGLTVNITGALLVGDSKQEEGLFDLEIQGTPQQIQNACTYLKKMEIEILGKGNPDGDGW